MFRPTPTPYRKVRAGQQRCALIAIVFALNAVISCFALSTRGASQATTNNESADLLANPLAVVVPKSMYTIYQIRSLDGICLYVGATKTTLERRLQQHKNSPQKVIKQTIAAVPHVISKIETAQTVEAAKEAETHWINKLCPTLNQMKKSTYNKRTDSFRKGCPNKFKKPATKQVQLRISADEEVILADRLPGQSVQKAIHAAIRDLASSMGVVLR